MQAGGKHWRWKAEKFGEGQRIPYSFVKPHMALDGQTPAQAAGLSPKDWKELLKAFLTNNE